MFEPDNWHVQDVVFHPNGLHAFIIEWDKDEDTTTVSPRTSLPASLQKGLIAYYPFNGNANDESGNEHHGKVNGPTLALNRFGQSQQAYQFDGNTNYIIISHHEDIDFGDSDEATVSLWVKPSRFQKSNGILSKYQSNGSNGYVLRLVDESGGLEWGPLARQSSYGISADNALQLLKWQHVVLVHDKGSSDLYLDAEMLARGPNRWSKNEDDLTIGRDYTEGSELNRLFAGSIDDVRIYNRALSAEEVKALYELEKP